MTETPPLALLLDIWEAACGLPPVQRDLAFLAARRPGSDRAELAGLPIGRRDALLIELYQAHYGAALEGLLTCGCGELLEVSIDLAALLETPHTPEAAWVSVAADGYRIDARLPDTTDLAAAATSGRIDADRGRAVLLQRLLRAWHQDTPISGDEAPDGLVQQALAALAESDPLAEVTMAVGCPNCASVVSARLDIGSHLWARIDADVHQGLGEVAALTRAFHWGEAEILAMNDRRRRAYLELLG